MSKLRNLYMYLVCFVSLMMVIWGFIATVNNAVNYLLPEKYDYYDTKPVIVEGEEIAIDNTEEIERQRIQNDKNEANRKAKGIVNSAVIVIVAIPVFLYHWKKIEKEKEVA